MEYNRHKHRRRSIRLKGYDYSQEGAYFITICTQGKECILGEIIGEEVKLSEYGIIVKESWDDLINHCEHIVIDAFVIMPNHVHGVVFINESTVGAIHELPLHEQSGESHKKKRRTMTLAKIVGRFKMASAKKINQLRSTPGIPVWQRNYYEHIIRNKSGYENIVKYIFKNPLRWHDDAENPNNVRMLCV